MIEGGEFHAWNTEWKNAWNARKDIFFFFCWTNFFWIIFCALKLNMVFVGNLFRSFVGNFVL